MSSNELKEISCKRGWVTPGSLCRRNSHGGHVCKLVFKLKSEETATLRGVNNRVSVVAALAAAKHSMHVCACGEKCRQGAERSR